MRNHLIRLVCLSTCPHRTNRLLQNGFSWNFIFEYFWKICRETRAIKIWQE